MRHVHDDGTVGWRRHDEPFDTVNPWTRWLRCFWDRDDEAVWFSFEPAGFSLILRAAPGGWSPVY